MKKLFIIRHGKSSWENPDLQDFDRPLNKRGTRDAPFMAKMLVGQGVRPDQIISSPANRALTTATYFAKENNLETKDIVIKHEIYEAYPEVLLQLAHGLSDELDTVFMFGHNPGFTYLANMFDGQYIPNIPTCGVVCIEAKIDQWKKLSADTGKIAAFHFPKQYF